MKKVAETILKRTLITINKPKGPPLSVVQFNTLADELSDAFPEANPEILKWDYRKELIIEELKQRNGDIICLEEVDHFDDFFQPNLEKLGYKGKFLMKTMENNQPRDGCALFYHSKFNLDNLKEVHFSKTKEAHGSQVGILAQFSFEAVRQFNIKKIKRTFLLAMTHLKAKEGHEELRKNQISHLMNEIEKMNENNYPVIIAGDLNDEPNSPCYQELSKRYSNSYKLYPTEDSKEPYTTFKKRKVVHKRCIDYIWYTKESLMVEKLLEIPNSDDLKDYLPCDRYPSDHLCIQTVFNFEQ